MKRRLAVIAAVASAMSVGAGTASAEYRQPTPTLELNPSPVAAGGTVTATLRETCVSGESIQLTIDPNDGGSNGGAAICNVDTFNGRFTAPTRPGNYLVRAVGGEGLIAEATLTVTAALDSPEQPLASTGPDQAVPMALCGGLLFAGGLALLGLSRLRPQHVDGCCEVRRWGASTTDTSTPPRARNPRVGSEETPARARQRRSG